MVKNPRAAARADQLRPLNQPRSVTVLVEADQPVALLEGGAYARIERIQDCWCIDDEWWREPIRRRYFQVSLATGMVRTIYHDEMSDTWHEQAY